MKALPTVNQKSSYAAAGIVYAEVTNNEEITDPVVKTELRLRALQLQTAIYIAEIKRRQLDQIDRLNNISTETRTVEIKNFDQIPLEENNKPKEEPKSE